MARVKVETIGAVVDGHPIGSKIEIDERSANAFEAIGYVRVLPKPKPKSSKKAKSAPKKTASKAKGDKANKPSKKEGT